jgi:hypothetical protein
MPDGVARAVCVALRTADVGSQAFSSVRIRPLARRERSTDIIAEKLSVP